MKLLYSLVFITLAGSCFAQITEQADPVSMSQFTRLISETATTGIELPPLDVTKLEREDELNDKFKDKPWRFGVNIKADYNIDKHGIWLETANGKSIWLFEVKAKGAKTINYIFDQFYLPPSAKLFIIDPLNEKHTGAITADNNTELNTLATWPLPGEKHLFQLEVNAEERNAVKLSIAEIIHGYRYMKDSEGIGDSDPCNRNAACPEGDPWGNQKKSVVMIVVGGSGHCTGTLMNNTLNNGRPYILTAEHCFTGSVTNWAFRFNYQSTECLNNTYSAPNQSVSGAILRARNSTSDMLLVEMATLPPASYNVYYAGWDRTDDAPEKQFAFHHPRGDLKKISINANSATKTLYLDQPGGQQTWKVDRWETGTTEGGSSGSALFDFNGRVTGHLIGGLSSCADIMQPDYYGRLAVDFINHDSTKSLGYWLDPGAIGNGQLDGYDPNGTKPTIDAAVMGLTSGSAATCSNLITPEVIIYNNGTQDLTSAEIKLTVDGGSIYTTTWTGNLPKGKSTTISFPELTLTAGEHSLRVELLNPNNTSDQFALNNISNVSVRSFPGGLNHTMKVVLDNFGSENYWVIKDQNNNEVASGGPYEDYQEDMVINHNVCLSPGCYTLFFTDLYGDGMCCEYGNGLYRFIENSGDTLARGWFTPQGPEEVPLTEQTPFCIDGLSIGNNNIPGINVFPNPASDRIFINQDSAQRLEVDLTDASGKIVARTVMNNTNNVLYTDTLANGIYFIEIRSGANRQVKKLSIIR